MENTLTHRTPTGPRLKTAFHEIDPGENRYAEKGHEKSGIGQKIRTRHHRNSPKQRHHGLLFISENEKSRTDGAPYNGRDHGL